MKLCCMCNKEIIFDVFRIYDFLRFINHTYMNNTQNTQVDIWKWTIYRNSKYVNVNCSLRYYFRTVLIKIMLKYPEKCMEYRWRIESQIQNNWKTEGKTGFQLEIRFSSSWKFSFQYLHFTLSPTIFYQKLV